MYEHIAKKIKLSAKIILIICVVIGVLLIVLGIATRSSGNTYASYNEYGSYDSSGVLITPQGSGPLATFATYLSYTYIRDIIQGVVLIALGLCASWLVYGFAILLECQARIISQSVANSKTVSSAIDAVGNKVTDIGSMPAAPAETNEHDEHLSEQIEQANESLAGIKKTTDMVNGLIIASVKARKEKAKK